MSEETSKPKRMRRWPFVVMAIIVLIGGVVYYVYNQYIASNRWKPLLQRELKELVLRSSDSLYRIEYSDFDLNISSGDATLYNFRLVPDTGVYQKLVALKKAPDNLFILSVKKLSIKNIGASKAYHEKVMNIESIVIENPDLTIIDKRFKFNDTVKVGKPKTPYQVLKKVFKQFSIDSVSLKDISLTYINRNYAQIKQTAIKHIDINISHVLIDSLSSMDQSRFYYTKGVSVTVHDYHIATPDSIYAANVGSIFFSTAERKMVLDKISLKPRLSRDAFYGQRGRTGEMYTLKFKRIDINDIDLQDFLRAQVLYAGTMNIGNGDVQLYSNNAYKGKKSSKIGKDPQQELQKLALDLNIKRINIKNTKISYEETDATTKATGQILFTHTNGYLLNVTNDDDQKRRNPFMRAYITTRFMDAALFRVNFKFNLASKSGDFNYSGELGSFDGKILDKLVKPLAMVHMESADIDKLDFNVDANNYYGKGNVQFYYKNLKIALLKKVEGKDELQKMGFVSSLANKLIIQTNNPDKKGIFTPGPIDLKRDSDITFFSFLYKALLDGLKPSVGYNKKTETQVNTTIVKVSNLVSQFKKFKEDRKERREERKLKRQAKRDSIKNAKENNGN